VRPSTARWLLFAALAAFAPLFFWLGIVAGWVPLGGMLVFAARNIANLSLWPFSLGHLLIYGFLLYGAAGLATRGLGRVAAGRRGWATMALVLALACVGLLPIYGAAHGRIQWMNAYQLYGSGTLR